MKKLLLAISSLTVPLISYAATNYECQKSIASNIQPKQELRIAVNQLKNKIRQTPYLQRNQSIINSMNMIEKILKVESLAKISQNSGNYDSCVQDSSNEIMMNNLTYTYVTKLSKVINDFSNETNDLLGLQKCEINKCQEIASKNLNSSLREINVKFSEQVNKNLPSYSKFLPSDIASLSGGVEFQEPKKVCSENILEIKSLASKSKTLNEATIKTIKAQDWMQYRASMEKQLTDVNTSIDNLKKVNSNTDDKIELNQCANTTSYQLDYIKYAINYADEIDKTIEYINKNKTSIKLETKCVGNDDCNQSLTNYFTTNLKDKIYQKNKDLLASKNKYAQ